MDPPCPELQNVHSWHKARDCQEPRGKRREEKGERREERGERKREERGGERRGERSEERGEGREERGERCASYESQLKRQTKTQNILDNSCSGSY